MKPSVKKAVSGRKMKVATIFTGAAACAGLAGGPAMAGTVHAGAAQPGQQPRVSPRAGIEQADCFGDNQSHWLHIGWSTSTESVVTCFGNKGTFDFDPDYYISLQCGGNNKGYISGTGVDGHRKVTYGHGTTWRNIGELSVSKVHISSWSGDDTCPTFPGGEDTALMHAGVRLLPGQHTALRVLKG